MKYNRKEELDISPILLQPRYTKLKITRPVQVQKFEDRKVKIRSRKSKTANKKIFYRAFYRFGQAKIAHCGLVLGLSQFLLLP